MSKKESYTVGADGLKYTSGFVVGKVREERQGLKETNDALRAEVAALKEQLRVFHSAEATLKRTEAQQSALRRLKEAVYEYTVRWT